MGFRGRASFAAAWFCVVWGLAGCAANPVSGRSDFVLMTEEEEIDLGRKAHPQIVKQYGGRYEDAQLQTYVQRVGERLAVESHRSDLIYRFTVLDAPLVNAFALPGGYIYITRGLLAYVNSEAELAAVLGHEIGHVTARHAVRQISGARAAEIGYTIGSIFVPELRSQTAQNLFNVLGSAISSGYGREHELESDRLGAEYLSRGGYDPRAMIEVIGILKNQEGFEKQLAEEEGRKPRVYHGVFASHPDNDQRLQEVIASVAAQPEQRRPPIEADQGLFLGNLEGLVFGEGEREGIVRGRSFYHREFGISFDFPAGWMIDNQADRLVATTRSGDAIIQVLVEDVAKRITPRDYLVQRLRPAEVSGGEEFEAGGVRGYTGSAEVDTSFGRRKARVGVVFHASRAFLFVAAGKEQALSEQHDREFLETVRGFHVMSAAEADLGRALRIHIVRADAATRFADLARASPLHSHAEEQLRLLNGLYPEGEPRAGQPLKVVR